MQWRPVDAYRLLDEVDAGLQIEAEVNEVPLDALTLVLFLLQDEHGVVEQLLQLLVGVVDAQLLEGVHLHARHGLGEHLAGASQRAVLYLSTCPGAPGSAWQEPRGPLPGLTESCAGLTMDLSQRGKGGSGTEKFCCRRLLHIHHSWTFSSSDIFLRSVT